MEFGREFGKEFGMGFGSAQYRNAHKFDSRFGKQFGKYFGKPQGPKMIVSFTGHRLKDLGGYKIPNPTYNYIRDQLKYVLLELKPKKAISGMALGFDTWAAQMCVELTIPFVAAVPFKGQENVWPQESKIIYKNLLDKAQQIEIISSGKYASWKMQIRNEWMVDNSNILIAAWNGKQNGGTFNCIKYAEQVGRKIYRIETCAH